MDLESVQRATVHARRVTVKGHTDIALSRNSSRGGLLLVAVVRAAAPYGPLHGITGANLRTPDP